MNTSLARALRGALPCMLAAVALLGCGKKDDPVAQAVKQDVAAGVPAPGAPFRGAGGHVTELPRLDRP